MSEGSNPEIVQPKRSVAETSKAFLKDLGNQLTQSLEGIVVATNVSAYFGRKIMTGALALDAALYGSYAGAQTAGVLQGDPIITGLEAAGIAVATIGFHKLSGKAESAIRSKIQSTPELRDMFRRHGIKIKHEQES
ncbi:hypothetical protein A2165_00125 [Candidatus Curtissbacteria bacterium RBG_13_40_7]|uniref:Uncharacterized protein n=1 Tax=Candidatus Curtissbacteria bacterium RBG_13_40_7 TaxID=1797706 RepID=A0A1F5FXR4_9BACT|nr:MAG: hypothetical protein A2165_00125 [Candidatus Curtissbacteria bacterium RBG_13_40_7]